MQLCTYLNSVYLCSDDERVIRHLNNLQVMLASNVDQKKKYRIGAHQNFWGGGCLLTHSAAFICNEFIWNEVN